MHIKLSGYLWDVGMSEQREGPSTLEKINARKEGLLFYI